MAGTKNFTIEQGADKFLTITWKDPDGNPRDLTGFSADLHFKVHEDDTDTVLELSLGSGITISDPTSGQIAIHITAAQTLLFDCECVYDLFVTSGAAVVTKLLQGAVAIDRAVTIL